MNIFRRGRADWISYKEEEGMKNHKEYSSAIWQFSFRFLPVFPVFWVSGNLETWKGNIY
jgi:hypothetical protein